MASELVNHVTDANHEEVLKSDKAEPIDFWAPWRAPAPMNWRAEMRLLKLNGTGDADHGVRGDQLIIRGGQVKEQIVVPCRRVIGARALT